MNNRPEFRFRLNGVIIPEIRIQRAVVRGEPVGDLDIAAKVPEIGWITVDDNSQLWDKDLPHFVLEYRNECEWSRLDPLQRRMERQKGWRTVSPRQLLTILEAAGYINIS